MELCKNVLEVLEPFCYRKQVYNSMPPTCRPKAGSVKMLIEKLEKGMEKVAVFVKVYSSTKSVLML